MTDYTTIFFAETYGISANFAQASDSIFCLGGDGEWIGTQYQVADFQHSPEAALRRILTEIVEAGGDNPDDFETEINNAIANITES